MFVEDWGCILYEERCQSQWVTGHWPVWLLRSMINDYISHHWYDIGYTIIGMINNITITITDSAVCLRYWGLQFCVKWKPQLQGSSLRSMTSSINTIWNWRIDRICCHLGVGVDRSCKPLPHWCYLPGYCDPLLHCCDTLLLGQQQWCSAGLWLWHTSHIKV